MQSVDTRSPTDATSLRLPVGAGVLTLDPRSGAVLSLRHGDRQFILPGTGPGGLLRIAAPRDDYPGHHLEVGDHSPVVVEPITDGVRLTYLTLHSDRGEVPIQVQLTLQAESTGLVLRARVRNDSDHLLPQVVFPQILGLRDVSGDRATRIQLARIRLQPFRDLALRVDDLWWVDWPAQQYLPYGSGEFAMKWLDIGDRQSGVTLYGRDRRYTTQGVVLDHRGPTTELVDLRWAHYPFIAPGESWDSGDFVLLTHDGDWYAGARAFAEFARPAYPYQAPQRIRDCLAIRSVWPAVRNAPPTYRFADLTTFAEEAADPSYGIGEVVLWHWWLKNGLPMIIYDRLGTAAELTTTLDRFRELGVPVSLFVSHNILRDTDETPAAWRHLNAAGQPVQDNWTYGYGFLPRFRGMFSGTHAMQQANPLSRDWRETALAEYAKALDYGATSLCFDVFRSTPDPEFNPASDGRPDEAGVALVELAEAARRLIHERDPEGTFSGEFAADTKMSVLDYTWEWINAYAIADSGPFRYVFPEFRLNANVGHPRAALIGFMEGALLNLMPGGMHTHRLADHPELEQMVRQLAALRWRHLAYFTRGRFRSTESLTTVGVDARSYTLDERVLVVAINPTDDAVHGGLVVDPTAWGGSTRRWTAEVTDLSGTLQQTLAVDGTARFDLDLPADGAALIELVPAGEPGPTTGETPAPREPVR